MKKPEEGIIEIEKVNKLKVWLHNLTLSDDIEDLKIQFDWENNKPTKKDAGGLMTDPYNPIRGEQYFIQVGKFFFEKKCLHLCFFLILMIEMIILSQEKTWKLEKITNDIILMRVLFFYQWLDITSQLQNYLIHLLNLYKFLSTQLSKS